MSDEASTHTNGCFLVILYKSPMIQGFKTPLVSAKLARENEHIKSHSLKWFYFQPLHTLNFTTVPFPDFW